MTIHKSSASDEVGFKRLVVLESEYRTHRPADQLHAIASFPQLFEEFPNPVIINSAFLKLADYFRNANNVPRHAILQVFKKSEAHLKLILNVEETIRRISPILQSNDPLSRALTLRVLGCMASIVHDRVDVYHNVIHCLDSTEAMEVSAAIFAADRICAHSQKFCAIISGKLAFMIRDPKVALPFKRRLIQIFRHMFEDITLARLARKTCLDMLELNEDAEYTVSIIKTLTHLASHSLVDVHQQIDFLLHMAWSHKVTGIRRVALMNLGSLAKKTIDFDPSQVKRLFDIAGMAGDEKTSIRAMGVLVHLFQSTYLATGLLLEEDGEQRLVEFLRLSVDLLSQERFSVASSTAIGETFRLVATMLQCYRSIFLGETAGLIQMRSAFEESLQISVVRLVEFLTTLWALKQPPATRSPAEEYCPAPRRYLSMYIELSLWRNQLVPLLVCQLSNWIQSFPCHSRLFLEAFHRIARQRPLDVQQHQEGLFLYLTQKDDKKIVDSENFVLACKSILTANSVRTSPTSESFVRRMTEILHRFGGSNNSMTELFMHTQNHWEMYQIGQASLQSGWPQLAHVAFQSLSADLETVPSRQWIGALRDLAQAEMFLSDKLVASMNGNMHSAHRQLDLSSPQQLYARAIGRLEEMELYNHRGSVDRAFQLQYCHLRSQFLQACQRTLILLSPTSLSPSSMAHSGGGRGGGNGGPRTMAALLQCADTLNEIAHDYTILKLQVAHHPPSELALEVLQTTCLAFAFSIQRVARSTFSTTNKRQEKEVQDTGAAVEASMDVFNIDPLLIPLLYVELTEHSRNTATSTAESSGGYAGKDLFRTSMHRLLRFIQETIDNNTAQYPEQHYSIVKQVVFQLLTLPVPFPPRFFNTL